MLRGEELWALALLTKNAHQAKRISFDAFWETFKGVRKWADGQEVGPGKGAKAEDKKPETWGRGRRQEPGDRVPGMETEKTPQRERAQGNH